MALGGCNKKIKQVGMSFKVKNFLYNMLKPSAATEEELWHD
jgi:hypothetical protein